MDHVGAVKGAGKEVVKGAEKEVTDAADAAISAFGDPVAQVAAEQQRAALVAQGALQPALANAAQNIKKTALSKTTGAMRNKMNEIPFLQEVIVSGELAKLAFDYLAS